RYIITSVVSDRTRILFAAGSSHNANLADRSSRDTRTVLSLLGLDLSGVLQGRQTINGFAGFLMGQVQFVQALQVEPKLRAGTEEMREAQSSIARHGTLSV